MTSEPRILLGADDLHEIIARLAGELSARFDDGVVLAAVLRGSVPFLADLIRGMTIHPIIDFMAISAYSPNSGRVRMLKDLDIDISGRDVVIVEDIVDTGLTSAFLRAELARRTPRSVSICTLLDRPARRVVPVDLEFVGREIPDEYVIGFGLDHEGRYRNLELVAVADPEVLRHDPDAYVAAFYGGA